KTAMPSKHCRPTHAFGGDWDTRSKRDRPSIMFNLWPKANHAWRARTRIVPFLHLPRTRPSRAPTMGRRWTVPAGRLLAKQSVPARLGVLVTGMVLPLTILAVVLVYYNYEVNRRTAYDRILQIARGVATNIDAEFRAAIASLEVLALSEALERDDLAAFRKQAEHFVKSHFPQSNVVVSDASGQQLLNTAVPTGTPLPRYVRMDALRRVLEKGEPRQRAIRGAASVTITLCRADEPIRGGVRHDHLRRNRGPVGVHSRTNLRMERCCRNSEVIPHD